MAFKIEKVEFNLLELFSQKHLKSVDINESFLKEKYGIVTTFIPKNILAKCSGELSTSSHI